MVGARITMERRARAGDGARAAASGTNKSSTHPFRCITSLLSIRLFLFKYNKILLNFYTNHSIFCSPSLCCFAILYPIFFSIIIGAVFFSHSYHHSSSCTCSLSPARPHAVSLTLSLPLRYLSIRVYIMCFVTFHCFCTFARASRR